jgi:L-fuculose-phosphate aldolase
MTTIQELKTAIVAYARRMAHDRLVTGTSGNISCFHRSEGLVAITPTGVDYDHLTVNDVSVLDLDGRYDSGLAPSSEVPMHLALYRHRTDIDAIVHTHSLYATTFAVLGEPVLAIHYMVTALGGDKIPVTSCYARYGTDELAQSALEALGTQYRGVLLRNHGVVTIGATLADAYRYALIVEEMAELYYRARAIGHPKPLSDQAIQDVMAAIQHYGQPRAKP